MTEDGPEQDALFYLEARDEHGCVWINPTECERLAS